MGTVLKILACLHFNLNMNSQSFLLKQLLVKICNLNISRNVTTKKPKTLSNNASLPVFQYASTKNEKNTRVYSWGLAEHGALGERQFLRPITPGRRAVQYMHRPYRLKFGEENEVTSVACGYGFSVFSIKSKSGYQVFGTGLNSDSQIGHHAINKGHPLELIIEPVPIHLPTTDHISQVACGRAHTVILTNTGNAFTLGHNGYGQCGRTIVENEDYQKQSIVHQIDIEEKVSQVVCGQDHSLFITEKGSVYSCGWSADGQTGLGHYHNADKVSKCKGDIEGENIVKVACGSDCVLALNDSGKVFGWGNSEYNQLNLATSEMQLHTPRYLPLSSIYGKIVDVSTTGTSCLILNDAGQVFVWGYGILGKGPIVEHSAQPTEIPHSLFGRNEFNPHTKVVSIHSGLSQFAAISDTGDLYMWGRNRYGSLGLGHLKDQFFPIKVCIPGYLKTVSIGVDHCVAISKSYI